MSVEVEIEYLGELQTRATHGPSGDSFLTDAPTDNGGRGEHFSPTDLVGTALGTCIVTIMGLVAERNKLDIRGTRVQVEKHMAAEPLRRIGRLEVIVTVPGERAALLSMEQRDKLEQAARHCPVHASLHPEIAIETRFLYGLSGVIAHP